MKFILPLLFCLSLTLLSCEKETNDDGPTDFRAVYVGKYHCIENINCYGALGSCSYTYDTIFSVFNGSSDTTISFLGREIWLDSTDSYYAYHYGLYFRNDSIFSSYMNGGLGGGQYENITGVKISDTP